MHLTDRETYTVKVIGKTTHREGEVKFCADRNQVTVEQSTRTTAAFRWPAQLGQCVNITLEEHRIKQNVLAYECDLSHLTMGRQYKVTIRGFDKELITIFRAEFTRNEMETLLGKAKTHVGDGEFLSCEVFYRNKPNAYFEECYNNHNGTMNVRLKDNGGDHASVINGQISGLFFTANVDFSTGGPFGSSPFGRKRVIYPAITLFHRDANLYFVHFYCMYEKNHYVTLVLTQPGSDVDHFCQRKKLIKLDNENNKFLRHSTDEENVEVTTGVMVEVYYTENLTLPDREFLKDVEIRGRGTSTPGGIPKHRYCQSDTETAMWRYVVTTGVDQLAALERDVRLEG
ncbi:hypothetical protein LSAT2_014624 [Lamellibrachia satsuma]|nr:hypothetical protein LSAT2_014624 [Lamellibrachia satsuma]